MQGRGLDLQSGKIPQLSLWATTTEACVSRAYTLQQEKPPQLEACTLQWRKSLSLPQLEKGCAQQQRSSAAIIKFIL